jgi:hypothetical protein
VFSNTLYITFAKNAEPPSFPSVVLYYKPARRPDTYSIHTAPDKKNIHLYQWFETLNNAYFSADTGCSAIDAGYFCSVILYSVVFSAAFLAGGLAAGVLFFDLQPVIVITTPKAITNAIRTTIHFVFILFSLTVSV